MLTQGRHECPDRRPPERYSGELAVDNAKCSYTRRDAASTALAQGVRFAREAQWPLRRSQRWDATEKHRRVIERSDRSLFVDGLRQWGEAPALKFDTGLSVSYRDLNDRVEAFAQQLGQARALILLRASLSLQDIVAYLAALSRRHPVILTGPDNRTASDELARLFGVDLIITADGAVNRTDEREHRTLLHPDLAVLLSTSGSTGGAKLVRLSRRNIEANAAAIADYLQLVTEDVGALTLPLHYSYGLSILNSHLLAGASLCLSQRPLTDPELLPWFHAVGCTNISGVPYSYEIFERMGLRTRPLPALRFMTAAGGRLPPDTVRTYADFLHKRGGRFFAMYGQTEASPRIAYLPPEAAASHADCIGIAIPGGELSLIDENGQRIERPGTTGELVYRGPNVMMGYATSPEDLARGSELEELRTGDLAERTADGFFRIVGRKNRFSKLAGFRVSHDEIEHRLGKTGVSAVVTGDDSCLVVAVTSAHEPDDVARRIMKFSNVTLAQMKVFGVQEVPRLGSGKIDYGRIRQLAAVDHSSPSGSVLESFSKAFWPRDVRPSDRFISLGGDSLTYVVLAVDLERILGRLPIDWEQTRIADLAAATGALSHWPLVDPSVYIRTIAILLVVGTHLFIWDVHGGASVLMTLVGYSLARFQSQALFEGKSRVVARQLVRNLLLYYGVLLSWMALDGVFRWPDLLLLSNVIAFPHEPVAYNAYWFVESYAHIVLGVALLCAVPAVRRRVADHPLGAGLIALSVSVALVFLGRLTWGYYWNACTQFACEPTTEVAYWAAIGWCLHFAGTLRRRIGVLLLASLALIAIGFTFMTTAVYVAVFCLLAWGKRLSLPPSLSAVTSYIASNSYTIYLFHLMPTILFARHFHGVFSAHGFLAELMALALAIGFPLAVAKALAMLADLYRRRRGDENPHMPRA